ncbi:MAG: gfo/Idh/MocA family oxidoreductase [Planctomycetota bacterium]|nr:MAG: gfo/Idh/MocA family oxidoreductase [Planctomycetota bacterium]
MKNISRRDFVKTGAVVSTAAMLSRTGGVFAAGSDKIRVGLIGCGGRGTGAAMDCVRSSANVEIVAMGDLFGDRLDSSLARLSRKVDDKVSVTKEASFTGFDAYKKVIACNIDMVILATPPHFRPMHLKAAIEAGKHVFMEKPVAVDPVGIRSIIASSELAKEKGLAIVAGTQRRHQNHYREILKRIHDGAIGEIVAGQCYWNMGGLWVKKKQPDWSEMEWQCRNWLYFTWLSGDHIVEQHVHNLDVINWAIGSHPVQCMGMGGREVRTAPEYGNIFDHFAVEFEYENGARVLSMCRQTPGCTNRVSEHVVGTKGSAYTDGGDGFIEGRNAYKFDGENVNPYQQEHADLIASIRSGKPLNEGRRVAESTLTAIMGRMSAYTGRALKWDWVMNASKLDLSPEKYEMCDLPVRPIAVPGKTELV